MNAHRSCSLVCSKRDAANVEHSELQQLHSENVFFCDGAFFIHIECLMRFNKT